jgi:hypothetical protein
MGILDGIVLVPGCLQYCHGREICGRRQSDKISATGGTRGTRGTRGTSTAGHRARRLAQRQIAFVKFSHEQSRAEQSSGRGGRGGDAGSLLYGAVLRCVYIYNTVPRRKVLWDISS